VGQKRSGDRGVGVSGLADKKSSRKRGKEKGVGRDIPTLKKG